MRFVAEWQGADGQVTPLAEREADKWLQDEPADPLIAVLLALERLADDFPRTTARCRRLIADYPDACDVIAYLAYRETGVGDS